MERAENTARMLDVNYQMSLLPQSAEQTEQGWRGVLGISELTSSFQERYPDFGARNVMEYMVRDARNPSAIVACIGATRHGQLLNVNADTLASHLAAALRARRLVIAGGTPGVLDDQGQTIGRLTTREAARLVKAGTANKGMVAKLQACRAALHAGVGDVVIADGRKTRLGTLADSSIGLSGCTQVVR